jgi:hypothetical protein
VRGRDEPTSTPHPTGRLKHVATEDGPRPTTELLPSPPARAAFGPIEVLEVLDHNVDRDQAATQSDVETFTGLLHPAEPL